VCQVWRLLGAERTVKRSRAAKPAGINSGYRMAQGQGIGHGMDFSSRKLLAGRRRGGAQATKARHGAGHGFPNPNRIPPSAQGCAPRATLGYPRRGMEPGTDSPIPTGFRHQPRVARRALPWVPADKAFNPNGVSPANTLTLRHSCGCPFALLRRPCGLSWRDRLSPCGRLRSCVAPAGCPGGTGYLPAVGCYPNGPKKRPGLGDRWRVGTAVPQSTKETERPSARVATREERPQSNPYGRWCGGRGLKPPAYPIGLLILAGV